MNIEAELIQRIIDPFEKVVDCEAGWHGLLYDLHDKLVAIDPNYTIAQVKEKHGGLRFYYNTSNPEMDKVIRSIVDFYEKLSYSVCEKTGQPGHLATKGNVYKTLSKEFLDDGWVIVDRSNRMPKLLEE